MTPSTVAEGSYVTLTCSTNSNPKVTRYAYFRGEDEIPSDGLGTYKFKAKKENSIYYKCRATNSAGTKESAVHKLDFLCKIISILFEEIR